MKAFQQQKALQVINLIDDELAFAVLHEEEDVTKVTQWLNTDEGEQFVMIDPYTPAEGLKVFIAKVKRNFEEALKCRSSEATVASLSSHCSVLNDRIAKEVASDEVFDKLHDNFSDALKFCPFHLDYGPFTWTQTFRLCQCMRKVRQIGMKAKVLVAEQEKEVKKQEINGHTKRKTISFGDDVLNDGGPLTSVILLRCYGDLEAFTNILSSLVIMSVQLGVISDVDHIRKFFSYDLLSKALVFHDASPHDDMESNYDLTVEDIAKGAIRAVSLWGLEVLGDDEGFIEPSEQFLKLKYGDMSWIVPGETVAFSCPVTDDDFIKFQNIQNANDGRNLPAPGRIGLPGEYYANLFGSTMDSSFFGGVGAVIKLNEEMYNMDVFERKGVEHFSIVYEDGSIPTSSDVDKFLGIMHRKRNEKKGVAVHCMAGLGRTGTLLCIDLIVNFGFLAKEAIGWCRLMRPGCVIGPQQQFLSWYENAFKRLKHIKDSFVDDTMSNKLTNVAEDQKDAVPPAEMTATLTTEMIMKKKAQTSFCLSTASHERSVSMDPLSKKLLPTGDTNEFNSSPIIGNVSSEQSTNGQRVERNAGDISYLLPPKTVSRSPSCPSAALTAGPPTSLTFLPFSRLGSHNIINTNSAPPTPTAQFASLGLPNQSTVALSSSSEDPSKYSAGAITGNRSNTSAESRRTGLDIEKEQGIISTNQRRPKTKLQIDGESSRTLVDVTPEAPHDVSTANPLPSSIYSNRAMHSNTTDTKSSGHTKERIPIQPLSLKTSPNDPVGTLKTTPGQTMRQEDRESTHQDPNQVQPHRHHESTLSHAYDRRGHIHINQTTHASSNSTTTPNTNVGTKAKTASGTKVFIVGSGYVDMSNYSKSVDKEVRDLSQKKEFAANHKDMDSRILRAQESDGIHQPITEDKGPFRQSANNSISISDSGRQLFDPVNTIASSQSPSPPPGTLPTNHNMSRVNITSSHPNNVVMTNKSYNSSTSANYHNTEDSSNGVSGLTVHGVLNHQSSVLTSAGILSTNTPVEVRTEGHTVTGESYYSPSRRVLIYLDD